MATRHTTKTPAPKNTPKYATLSKCAGASTRVVSTQPNLQQVPKGTAQGKVAINLELGPLQKPTNPKDAIASTKLPLHLWPATATAMGCLGLLDGATKYGLNNYRALGAKASVYVGAVKRHLDAWMEGEDNASDSGVPHLANALACLAILVDCQAAGNLVDDRSYPGGYHELVGSLTEIANRLQADRAHLAPHHYTKQDVA